jgi:hypothetical protein
MMLKQSEIELASARSFLWRYLGAAFSYPDEVTWTWLRTGETWQTLQTAVRLIHHRDTESTENSASSVSPWFKSVPSLEEMQSAYLSIFGHTVRGDCPARMRKTLPSLCAANDLFPLTLTLSPLAGRGD